MRKRRTTVNRVIRKMRLPYVLRTEKRQKEVRLRKNFLPTVLIIFVLWLSLAYMIFFVSPERNYAVTIFFSLLFLSLLFTVSTILANTRRGLLISIATTAFLILTYLGVGTFVNLLLLIAIAVIIEIYLIKA